MAIRFRCPACDKRYVVGDHRGGQQGRCKVCGHRVIIPEAVPPDLEPGATQVEYAESGQPIFRHGPRQKEVEPVVGDSANIERISQHIEEHIGPVAFVFHELVSDLVHVDVHWVKPTDERPYHTLITSGMSDLPMNAPEGAEECHFAELMLSLPPDWPLSQKAFEDENHYWPIRWLKMLARFPHEYDTWLWWGHTVPNGDPPEAFADNTRLCCLLVLHPMRTAEAFHQLPVTDDRTIHFFSLVPLYPEEMAFKLKHGSEALVERFELEDVTELLDVRRKNVCKKKRWPF